MLQWYSVRLRIHSWFIKYCHPNWRLRASSLVTLVGANSNNDPFANKTKFTMLPFAGTADPEAYFDWKLSIE